MNIRIAAAALLLSLAPMTAWAQAPAPANSQIQAVYDDLDRFDQQANGASKSRAKQILRLLSLTEERLKGAPDQGDPSWQAAADRLAGLQQQLTNLAEGKPATASAPAPAAPAPASEAAAPTVEAAPAIEAAAAIESADPVVAAAAAEIARLSALADAMAPGDKAAGKQYIGELQAIGNQLRGVGTKDQAWSDTAQAYNALQNRIVAIANAAAAPGSTPAATQSAAADPNVERARRELGFNDRNIAQMRGGSLQMEQRVLGDLNRIRAALDQAPDKSHPAWQEADAEWQRQLDTVAEKRLAAIGKELEGLSKQIDGLDAVALTTEQTVGSFKASLDDLAGQMAVYDVYASKEGYAGTWDSHTKVTMQLQERVAAAQATESQFGDVKAQIALIEQQFRETPVPQALREFPSKEVVVTYAETMKRAYAESVQASQYLQQISGKTSQVDKQTLQRLSHWAGTDRLRSIDESLKETRNYLDGKWSTYQGILDFRATDDVTDPNHLANRFLMQGRFEENIALLKEGLQFVAVADAYEKALGSEDDANRLQQQAALQNAINKYEADFQTALSTMRMAPGIDDDGLREIAAKTLENPSYGVNLPWERLEVGKKTHREEARSEISGNSIVTNLYKWDEFQARTAEQVDGKWYIFVNDLKYFYSGASTTPLDRWLVAGRWQAEQILEENIDK